MCMHMSRSEDKPARNSRDLILNAAEALVSEIGAARLTIDAVAARSGLSKGGVLYNFPSKDALIGGMMPRLIEDCASDIAALAGATSIREPNAIRADRQSAPGWISQEIGGARIAGGACGKSRAASHFREFKQTEKAQILSETGNAADALMIWSAIEGLVFTSALGLKRPQ